MPMQRMPVMFEKQLDKVDLSLVLNIIDEIDSK